jgi:protein disulfide-isomerase-like protein
VVIKQNINKMIVLSLSVAFLMVLLLHSKGEVIELTDESLSNIVGESNMNDVWLVKFYAPWCRHCTKIAPVLDEVSEIAKESNGHKVRVAKIDADKYKKQLKHHDIKGFPTIKLFYGGAWHDYKGLRQKTSFLDAIEKMQQPSFIETKSFDTLKKTEVGRKADVIFVLQQGEVDLNVNMNVKGTQISDKINQQVEQKFDRTAENHKLEAQFAVFTSRSSGEIYSRILKFVRDPTNGELRLLTEFLIDSEEQLENMGDWCMKNNHGIITKFDDGNFKRLGSLGKYLVIAIIQGDKTTNFEKDFRAAVVSDDNFLHTESVLGILDGDIWYRFTKRFSLPTPSIVVIDFESSLKYVQSLPISRDEISQLFSDLKSNKLEFTTFTQNTWWGRVVHQWNSYAPWSYICILPLILIIISLCTPLPPKEHTA